MKRACSTLPALASTPRTDFAPARRAWIDQKPQLHPATVFKRAARGRARREEVQVAAVVAAVDALPRLPVGLDIAVAEAERVVPVVRRVMRRELLGREREIGRSGNSAEKDDSARETASAPGAGRVSSSLEPPFVPGPPTRCTSSEPAQNAFGRAPDAVGCGGGRHGGAYRQRLPVASTRVRVLRLSTLLCAVWPSPSSDRNADGQAAKSSSS